MSRWITGGALPSAVANMSGSTLISQSLKHLDNLVVYAEPQPVNEILVPPHRWPRADLVAALRTLGDAFARHAGRPYVLKLSSWNTLFCDIITEAFPETNWVLNLRDPVEVGVSLQRQPPGWLSGTAEASRSLIKIMAPEEGFISTWVNQRASMRSAVSKGTSAPS